MSHLDYEINKELGECYLFMGELDKAEDYYQKAASSNGIHADPYLGLATIAVQKGDLEKAMSLYKKAADVEPNDKSFAGMALIEMETGNTKEAFTLFVKALEINPENMVALYGLVQAGHTLNRLEEVIVHLQNYLQLNPNKIEVRYSLAGCLMGLGKNEEAKKQIQIILEQDPNNKKAQELLLQLDN
ncbi:tetratricopeptide repeat protein [Desulfovulcanus sp.]